MALWPDPPFEPIHARDYLVKAFRKGPDEVLIRGSVEDQKPPHGYIEGDPEPLTMHYMVVDLTVAYPDLVITGARVLFETYPQAECPRITNRYGELVGSSVARGFTHKVRELFGGPRGCAHVTALLQAMAPVAVQCRLSMRVNADEPVAFVSANGDDDRRARISGLINTCHAWAADGPLVTLAERGDPPPLPIPISERLQSLGKDPEEWRSGPTGRTAVPGE
jgi:hypothetical protein